VYTVVGISASIVFFRTSKGCRKDNAEIPIRSSIHKQHKGERRGRRARSISDYIPPWFLHRAAQSARMSKVGCNITDAAKKSANLKSKSQSRKQVTLKQVSTSQSGGPMVMTMERRVRDLSVSGRDGLYEVAAR
jgi:hypothetical protein